jgi:hypothetical protein
VSLSSFALLLWKSIRSKPNAIPVSDKKCSPCHRNRVRLHNGILFGITPEWCSASDRNRVRLRPDSPVGRGSWNCFQTPSGDAQSQNLSATRILLGSFKQDSEVNSSAVFASSLVRSVGPSIGSIIDQIDNLSLQEVGGLNELATPWYSDQVLPFDVTLAGANEYGAMMAAKIFGVEILNEGQGISIDDAVSEMQATFVARAVEPMQAVE